MRAILAAAAAACMLAAPALAQIPALTPSEPVFEPEARPVAPPTGEERAKMIDGIRKSYPVMPDNVVELLADQRRLLNDLSRCEIIDFLLLGGSGAAPHVVERAKRHGGNCALGTDDITPAIAAQKLGAESYVIEVSGNAATIIARSKAPEVVLCCTLQNAMTRIGDSDLWVSRRRLPELERGIISIFLPGGDTLPDFGARKIWRGPKAPPAPPPADPDALKGLVLQRELRSDVLGETRRLQIYLPIGHNKDRVWPALFLADGGAATFAPLVEAMIERGEIEPIVMISAESGEEGVVGKPPEGFMDLRSSEYIRGIGGLRDAVRFAAHMKFFTEELTHYATSEFNASPDRARRAVTGFSNGGDFALWAGLMHPEVFGTSIPMSPGSATVTRDDLRPKPLRARFLVSGGLYEPGFLEEAIGADSALRAAGFDVAGDFPAAGHDPTQWEDVLYRALKKVFPPR